MSSATARTMTATTSAGSTDFPYTGSGVLRCNSPQSLNSADYGNADTETYERVVRFDNECVLIPECMHSAHRRTRVVTKSYSLPLWKKKREGGSAISDSESEQRDDHVMFKVSVPRIVSNSRSPTHSPRSPEITAPPCLVKRASSGSIPSHSPRVIQRRPSLPNVPRPDIVTVPLRSCCSDCLPIIEEAMREGDHWQEKFTRGARRKRSLSLDTPSNLTSGFAALSCNETEALISSSAHGCITINVDEVDKRRKSIDEGTCAKWGHGKDISSSSSASVASNSDVPAGLGIAEPVIRKASPIVEEDEDELFPLPSPRRSPGTSPVPSPNPSTSCLAVAYPSVSGSRDSLRDSGSEESSGSKRRPSPRCPRELLTPESSPSMLHHIPAGLKELPSRPSPAPTKPVRPLPQVPISSSSSSVTQLPSPLPSPTSPVEAPLTQPTPIPHPNRQTSYTATPPPSPPNMRKPDPHSHAHNEHGGVDSSPTKHRRPSFGAHTASFLRASAEALKGVSSLTGGSGAVPLAS